MVIFVRFMRTTLLTILTPLAFAANSILCRLALSSGSIDPASFATIRLLAGALALAAILSVRDGKKAFPGRKNWISAAMLAAYAVAFSFAYIDLSAGTGALILFGAVQVTMILLGLRSGERPGLREWAGLFLALAGLVYLTSPGLTAPAPLGSLLMGSAGVAWGVYSVRGKGISDPVRSTAQNFILAALRGLTSTRAAIVQLAVPVIATLGGVVFLAEEPTMRLFVASVVILGGVGISVGRKGN